MPKLIGVDDDDASIPAGLALSPIEAGEDGGELRLPRELIGAICVEAAASDWRNAHSLALTSRDICRLTAKARWKTVVLTTWRQCVSFWKAITGVPDHIAQPFYDLADASSASHHRETDQDFERCSLGREVRKMVFAIVYHYRQQKNTWDVSGLSLPDRAPHLHVENLFIDVARDNPLFDHMMPPSGPINAPENEESGDIEIDDSIFPHTLLACWKWDNHNMPKPRLISLGAFHTKHAPHRRHDDMGYQANKTRRVEEVTEVIDEEPWELFCPRSVRRLHIVGVHSKSEYTGIEPPWESIGSLIGLEFPGEYAAQNEGKKPFEPSHVTHMRYDTRRFSLKPAEITVQRMRAMLQEPALAPHPWGANSRIGGEVYRHQGPRHAAPRPSAGNTSVQVDRAAALTPVAHLDDKVTFARALREIGVGQLRLLQLSWEPMSKPSDTVQHPNKTTNGREGGPDGLTMEETGGWPREVRGAWTERSERTNEYVAFAAELRDAMDSMHGWDAPGIEGAARYCSWRDCEESRREAEGKRGYVQTAPIRANTAFVQNNSPAPRQNYHGYVRPSLESRCHDWLVRDYSTEVAQWKTQHRQACVAAGVPHDPQDPRQLIQTAYRAPRSLVHFGGKAALLRENRLQLFEDRVRGGRGAWP